MEKLPYIVDGTDFTALVHKYGYEVSYEFREGENGGLMCSGDELRDLLAVKPVVAVTINDAPTAQISALLAACLKNEVSLRYFDPRTGAAQTVTMHPTVDTVPLRLSDGSTRWWSGFHITMRAK